MNYLFSDITTMNEQGDAHKHRYITVEGEYITGIFDARPAGVFDREISGKNKLLMPALYNCHAHTAMTLFRGYGEDMPLSVWLNDCIFPAEDLLTSDAVYNASMLAAAEMIRCGIVSFSDMYFFSEDTIRAVGETGMKANIARCINCFNPEETKETDKRFLEALALHKQYHNSFDGRIKMDMSVHAEYTTLPHTIRYVAEAAKALGLHMHVHMSETASEHRECMERNGGKTPAQHFASLGVFDVPTIAAHCVWVTDEDIALMAEKGVFAAHNPVSNLKLGSGIMPLDKMHRAGVRVVLGTDGAASNNRLDILREMNTAALLQKGRDMVCDAMKAADMIPMATVNGAMAQGREDCGKLAAGCRADIILLDMDTPNNIPSYTPVTSVVYSATASDVCMTMADGKILYENGQYTTLDIEMVKHRMRHTVAHYFDQK
ncbi:MAG: amidohydrolase [Clostridia bacterium]|nr:amidohydrolase [Clostridia bacterium]